MGLGTQPRSKDGSCAAVRVAGRRGRSRRDDVVYVYDGITGCLWTYAVCRGWDVVRAHGPHLAAGFGFAYDPVSCTAWVAGCDGRDGGFLYSADVASPHTGGWTQLCPLKRADATVRLHCHPASPSPQLLVFFAPDDLAIYSPRDGQLHPTPRDGTTRPPGSVTGYSLVAYGNSAVAFGGQHTTHPTGPCSSDVFLLKVAPRTGRFVMERQCCGGVVPSPRAHHAADVVNGDTLLVAGGVDAVGTPTSSAHALHLPSMTWRPVVVTAAYPSVSRYGHVVAFLEVPYGVLQIDHMGAVFVASGGGQAGGAKRPLPPRQQAKQPRPPPPTVLPRRAKSASAARGAGAAAPPPQRPARVWSSGGNHAAPQLFSNPTLPLYREVDMDVERKDGKAPPVIGPLLRASGNVVDSIVQRLGGPPSKTRSRTEDEYLHLIHGGETHTLTADEERRHVERMHYQEMELQAVRRGILRRKWVPRRRRKWLKGEAIERMVQNLYPQQFERQPTFRRKRREDPFALRAFIDRLYTKDIARRKERLADMQHRLYYSERIAKVGYEGMCVYDETNKTRRKRLDLDAVLAIPDGSDPGSWSPRSSPRSLRGTPRAGGTGTPPTLAASPPAPPHGGKPTLLQSLYRMTTSPYTDDVSHRRTPTPASQLDSRTSSQLPAAPAGPAGSLGGWRPSAAGSATPSWQTASRAGSHIV